MTGGDPLLAQLADIRGLAPVGWWPLAPIWWMILVLASSVAGIVYWRRLTYARSWKGDADRALRTLQVQLAGGNTREVAAALSALLRRVAMQCFSRAECAGLRGHDWLKWLSAKDPAGFDWTTRGTVLIEAPYAPPGRNYSPDSLLVLIHAAKKWLK